jgi:hypothetical protein
VASANCGGSTIGTSFIECTAMSARPSSMRDLELLHEEALAAHLRERPVEDAVALGGHADDLDRDAGVARAQRRGDHVGLASARRLSRVAMRTFGSASWT